TAGLSYKAWCNANSAVTVDFPHCREQFNSNRRAGEVRIFDCTASGVRPQSRASITGSSARAKSRPRLILLSSTDRLRLCLDHWRRLLCRLAFDSMQNLSHRRTRIGIRLQRAHERGAQFQILRLHKHANCRANLMLSKFAQIFSDKLKVSVNGAADLRRKLTVLGIHRGVLQQ